MAGLIKTQAGSLVAALALCALSLRERQTQRIPVLGADREDFSDADPIAFDAAQAAEGIQPPHSVMFRLSVKQREWFEDLVARAGP